MKRVFFETMYAHREGGQVHSDGCSEVTTEFRVFLHALLDEWLDNGNNPRDGEELAFTLKECQDHHE